MSESIWVALFEDGTHVSMKTHRFYLTPATNVVAIIRYDYFQRLKSAGLWQPRKVFAERKQEVASLKTFTGALAKFQREAA